MIAKNQYLQTLRILKHVISLQSNLKTDLICGSLEVKHFREMWTCKHLYF